MNDAAHMCCGQSARHLCGNCCGASWHEWSDAAQHRGEIFTVDKLHHNCWRLALWRNVKHSGNVWVRDDCGGSTLGTEAVSGGGRCCEWRAKYLNGHIAAERLIGCAEDEGGCAFANQLLQPIPASNNVAGLQRSLVALCWCHERRSRSVAIAPRTIGP